MVRWIFCLSLLLFPHLGRAAESLVRVQIYRVESTNLASELKYPATVTPRAQGKLTSEVSGVVTNVRKRLGSKITAGEAVFYVRQTQIGVEFNDYAVRSPISGVLSQLDYSLGQYLQAGTAAGEVIDPEKMKVSVEAPAQDVEKLKPGLNAQFLFDSEHVDMRVSAVSPVANPTTGTTLVELEPTKRSRGLRAGSVGRAIVFLPPQKGLAVPARAVVTLGAENFVRLVDKDSRVHFVKVLIGPLVRDLQVIHDGLKPQDEVVVKASGHLKEGDAVVRTEDSAPPAS